MIGERRAPDDPVQRVLDIFAGKTLAQAVFTAAELRLPDHLSDGPRSIDELAAATDSRPALLERLCQMLSQEGVLERLGDGRLATTDVARQLETGRLGDLAAYLGSPQNWNAWSGLTGSIRTGRSAFELTHGAPLFDWLSQPEHAEEARVYDEAMDSFSCIAAREAANRFDYEGYTHFVDVGGGRGTLLLEVLARWPHLKGTLVDLPSVAERSRPRLEAALGDRVSIAGGDFHDAVPEGADLYAIKHVVHNWPDDLVVDLLSRCASAMAPGGRVLVIEGVLLPISEREPTRILDVEMIVLTEQGRERSKPEFRKLLRAAGLRLVGTHPLGDGIYLLEAAKAA